MQFLLDVEIEVFGIARSAVKFKEGTGGRRRLADAHRAETVVARRPAEAQRGHAIPQNERRGDAIVGRAQGRRIFKAERSRIGRAAIERMRKEYARAAANDGLL